MFPSSQTQAQSVLQGGLVASLLTAMKQFLVTPELTFILADYKLFYS
jgi:hypothetical protein